MMRTIASKTLYQKRWSTLSWTIGFLLMTLLTMTFYPSFKSGGWEELAKNVPPQLAKLIGNLNLKTVAGYVGDQIFALRLPLMALVLAIMTMSGFSAGEEDRGITASQLTLPIARWRLALEKYAAGLIILAIAHVGIFIGVALSFRMIDGSMSLVRLTQATFGCWLLATTYGSIAYGLGLATGKRGITSGVTTVIATLSIIITTMAPSVESLKSFDKLSPYHYYLNPSIAKSGLDFAHVGILFFISIICVFLGILLFIKRDIQN